MKNSAKLMSSYELTFPILIEVSQSTKSDGQLLFLFTRLIDKVFIYVIINLNKITKRG